MLSHWGLPNLFEKIANTNSEEFIQDIDFETACKRALPYLSASWAQDHHEVQYLVYRFLFSLDLLEQGPSDGSVQITPKGWEFLEMRPELEGKQCFVAMWFDPSMHTIWQGPIIEGIRKAGYEPFRVDNKEHNDDITDEILAGIRRSKFMLADFTGHRGGVYYEAGFAAGLGKQVVRTVRQDEAEKVHFDTRQLNHIRWKADALKAFSEAITNRIVATIGQGPVRYRMANLTKASGSSFPMSPMGDI